MTQLSADWWLLTVTGTIAATSAQVRSSLRNEGNSTSYAGDTTKGAYLAAAALTVVT